jgi:uncharacterized membrane protein
MILSRPFRALLKLAGLFAIPWTALGIAIGTIRWMVRPELASTGSSLATWLFNHALGYGALGLITGLYFGLLLARLERGRTMEAIPRRRIAGWSAVAGGVPAVLFAALGLIFGAPPTAYLPLLGLGATSALVTSRVATSAIGAAQRHALGGGEPPPRVRAT